MTDPPLSDMDFKNIMAWVWTTLNHRDKFWVAVCEKQLNLYPSDQASILKSNLPTFWAEFYGQSLAENFPSASLRKKFEISPFRVHVFEKSRVWVCLEHVHE